MEEARRSPRERELVLAPNEYAYVLDTTKGHINCYVGPNKTSLAQTDQPVVFNADTKRFDAALELADAVQLQATAPANWYLLLKNPAKEGAHPKPGMASATIELLVGRKVVVPGPCSFALWPGQMARVLEGHRLKSNQYLVVRVYDADEANKHVQAALGGTEDSLTAVFETGSLHVIRGTDVSFYIPPTGVEVVPDHIGTYVRDAVALERLETCTLIREDGKKRIVRGAAVVFPGPDEVFVEDARGNRRQRAIELSETTGLHLKVTAPYVDDDGVAHVEGEELFLTGKNRLYFPREEHAVVRSGGSTLHHAVAIPAGAGRYVLDRSTGAIELRTGPLMFLPDPRHEVIVRRVLADRESLLFYPGNAEALDVNRALRRGGAPAPTPAPAPAAKRAEAPVSTAATEGQDRFERSFTAPRMITLDGKYDGAIAIEVWSGFAVQVVDKRGGRRVVRGPQTVLLDWDETLESLSLSTGTPKTTQRLLSTAFLQVSGNQVSDVVDVVSADLVPAQIGLKFRVRFEGEAGAERWFDVDNYIKLLCDHASSLVRAAARQVPIRRLRAEVSELVRDCVLGKKPEGGARAGLAFSENGMRVYDVEVLDVEVTDEGVRGLLADAQVNAVRSAVAVAEREAALHDRHRIEEIERKLLHEEHETRLMKLALETEREQRQSDLEQQRLRLRYAFIEEQRQAELKDAEADSALRAMRAKTQALEAQNDVTMRAARQALDVELLRAQVQAAVQQAQAFSPELVETVKRLGDAQLLSSLAQNFGELAAVEGKGLLETARKFLDFMPTTSLPQLRAPAARQGDAE